MFKFKVGDVVCPIEGSYHHRKYGNFVAKVSKVPSDKSKYYEFETIEEGYGEDPIAFKYGKDFLTPADSADEQFELTYIVNSPLYKALS